MFNVDYKNLRLSFNDFHEVTDKDMPQYGIDDPALFLCSNTLPKARKEALASSRKALSFLKCDQTASTL